MALFCRWGNLGPRNFKWTKRSGGCFVYLHVCSLLSDYVRGLNKDCLKRAALATETAKKPLDQTFSPIFIFYTVLWDKQNHAHFSDFWVDPFSTDRKHAEVPKQCIISKIGRRADYRSTQIKRIRKVSCDSREQ